MTDPTNPQTVGRYQIVSRLGEGGMGVLYLANDPLLRRTVAIKVLSVRTDELRERFAREARSAASLRHSHIVTIYDIGDDRGLPFLAMEYLDGETMSELIRRRPPLPTSRKVELLLELCEGLGYAHRAGIIHRDIKPANLMITADGILKILDFGLARLSNDAAGAGLTRVGTLIGTPNYMSPERILGETVDHRSDIFAVGLVAYELLTYKKAYPGEAHVVLDKVLHSEPQSLQTLAPDLDPRLTAAVERAIRKDPAQRFDSLALLAAELAASLEDPYASDVTVRMVRPPSTGSAAATQAGSAHADDDSQDDQASAARRASRLAQCLASAEERFAAGDYTGAIEQSEQAAAIDPEDARVTALLRRAQDAAEDRQVAQWLLEAQGLASRGQLTEASRLIDDSLDRRPDSAEAHALQQHVRERRRERERTAERERAAQSAMARARASIEQGALDAAIRCTTEALAHDPGREEALALKAFAQRALQEREARDAAERVAEEAMAEARRLEAEGNLAGALAHLRASGASQAGVQEAITALESQLAALERQQRADEEDARRREQERLDVEEAARRRQLSADRQANEALACLDRGEIAAGERLARAALEFVPDHGLALQLVDRARRQFDDQQRTAQLQREANAAAGAARRLFVNGDHAGAVRLLEAFTPRTLVAPVLQEIEDEWRRQQSAAPTQSIARPDSTARDTSAERTQELAATPIPEEEHLELLEQFTYPDPEAPAPAPLTLASAVAAPAVPAPADTVVEAPRPPIPPAPAATVVAAPRPPIPGDRTAARSSWTTLAATAALLAVLLAGGAAWWTRHRAAAPQPDTSGGSAEPAAPSVATDVPPPAAEPAAPPAAPVAAPAPAPAAAAPVDTASLDAARRKLGDGDLAGAAALVVSGLSAQSPPGEAWADSIAQIRTAAAGAAQSARAKAVRADARGTASYDDGDEKETEAAAITDPADLVKAVGLYQEAAAAYKDAEAVGVEVDQLARSAADALRQGDNAKALTDASQALIRYPRSKPVLDVLAALRTRAQRDTAAARSDAVNQGAVATQAFKDAEITRAGAEKMTDPKQTRERIEALDRARTLYASATRDAVGRKAELPAPAVPARTRTDTDTASRRTAPAPRATRPASYAADRDAITSTLQAYANAHARLDAREVVRVAPYLAGAPARDLASTFRTLTSLSMRIQRAEPAISADGLHASAQCTINRDVVSKVTGLESRRTEAATFTFEKQDGRWVITNVQGPGR